MLRYFLFYKPYQVLSQFSKEGDKKTLADFFHDIPNDVYPIGRLDFDSEGLLVLTNDKKLTQFLLDPKYKHPRTYLVQVEGIADADKLKKLAQGVAININGKTYQTQKAITKLIDTEPLLPERNPPIRFRKNLPTSWCAITLTEGKNRQVRKMTAAVGLPTLRLVRYSIGSINIEQMQSGNIVEINAQTAKLLLKH